MKVAFLDRDGTINRDYADAEWANIRAPEMLDGAVDAMRCFRRAGYSIIIVTNQYTIGEGIISLQDYHNFADRLLHALSRGGVDILDVFFCPHKRDVDCACRKPKPGMIRAACRKYPQIDLARSFFVGDAATDMELARRCGLRFYGIGLDCENRIEGLSDMIGILGAN